jgi:hypothetical protein
MGGLPRGGTGSTPMSNRPGSRCGTDMQSRMQQTKRSGCGAVQAQHHVSMVPFSREFLAALGLGYGHSTVLLPPAVLGFGPI